MMMIIHEYDDDDDDDDDDGGGDDDDDDAQAGALMAMYTGALRPGDRLEVSDAMYKCRFCQQA
eukprot:5185869-Karenia_brevis.AAC.1